MRRSTTAYHPQCDSLTERFNQTLLGRLAFYVNHTHDNWDQHIPYVLFSYRTAVHATTGYTPYFLMFNNEPFLLRDMSLLPSEKIRNSEETIQLIHQHLQQAQHNIIQNQIRQQKNYNKKRKPHDYSKEDLIWIFSPVMKPDQNKEFTFDWLGTYQIIQIYPNDTLDIVPIYGLLTQQRVHISRTKRCYNSSQPTFLGISIRIPKRDRRIRNRRYS